MVEAAAAFLALVSGSLLLLALWSLSQPGSGWRGDRHALAGIAAAVAASLLPARPSFGAALILVIGFAIGGAAARLATGGASTATAQRLVAAFQSLLGLAAVTIAAAAFHVPEPFGAARTGLSRALAPAMMAVGAALGAAVLTVCVAVFLEIRGGPRGTSAASKRRRLVAPVALAVAFLLLLAGLAGVGHVAPFWLAVAGGLVLGALLVRPMAGLGAPCALSALNSGCGWTMAAVGFGLDDPALVMAGGLVGSAGAVVARIAYGEADEAERSEADPSRTDERRR